MTSNSKNYVVTTTLEEHLSVINYLQENPGVMAVDTETTGDNPHTCTLIGISFSIDDNEAFYLALQKYNKELNVVQPLLNEDEFFKVRLGLMQILENPKNHLLMHNSPYDVIVIRRGLGADPLKRLKADTLLLKHTVDERKPHGLKKTMVALLGPGWDNEQEDLKKSVIENGGKFNETTKEMYRADINVLGKYACADADGTRQIFFILEGELAKQGLTKFFYEDEVMPLNLVTIKMIERGIRCDLPYFTNLKKELETEAVQLETEAHDNLKTKYPKYYESFERDLLEETYPLKDSGLVFERLYMEQGLPVIHNKKTGTPTFNAKVLQEVFKDNPDSTVLQWKLKILSKEEFFKKEEELISQIKRDLYLEKEQTKHVINLASNKQLSGILFGFLGESPIKTTEKGNPQVDKEILEHFAPKYAFVDSLWKLRKVTKLLSTYVEGIMSSNINGIVHPSWLQFGTDSGRYACKDPNFQNLPRDDHRIKEGIIARDGYALIGADYSQLEPRCFAHCSGEKALIQPYIDDKFTDLYSAAAVDWFNLGCTPGEVRAKFKDKRDIMKGTLLGITYGAKKWKVSKLTGKNLYEADKFITDYFKKYARLNLYIKGRHGSALKYGKVQSEAGRIRRFADIHRLQTSRKKADYIILNKLLNIAVNFSIQSLAASIVNRAMIAINRAFEAEGLDAYVAMQVHDEIVAEVRKDQAKRAEEIMKDKMENTYLLSLPLVAEPKIGTRLSETK